MKILRVLWRCICNVVETIMTALLILLIYVLYLPFGICKALFSASEVKAFYHKLLSIADNFGSIRRPKA